jgi:hypothetical protein
MVYLGLSGGGIRGRGRQFIENFLFNERKIVCVVRAARNSPWRAQLDNGSFGLATHTHTDSEGNNFYLFVGRLYLLLSKKEARRSGNHNLLVLQASTIKR